MDGVLGAHLAKKKRQQKLFVAQQNARTKWQIPVSVFVVMCFKSCVQNILDYEFGIPGELQILLCRGPCCFRGES